MDPVSGGLALGFGLKTLGNLLQGKSKTAKGAERTMRQVGNKQYEEGMETLDNILSLYGDTSRQAQEDRYSKTYQPILQSVDRIMGEINNPMAAAIIGKGLNTQTDVLGAEAQQKSLFSGLGDVGRQATQLKLDRSLEKALEDRILKAMMGYLEEKSNPLEGIGDLISGGAKAYGVYDAGKTYRTRREVDKGLEDLLNG